MTYSPNRKVNKGIILIALVLLSYTKSFAQELNVPIATQYLADNPFVISPTYAGIGDNFRIRVNGLAQWIGIKDAPRNQAFYADFRIADQSGVGLSLYNDKNGATRQTGLKASFAHHIILDYYSKQYLSFGISFNMNTFRFDTSDFKPSEIDAYINSDKYTSNNNFDVGLLYRRKAFFLSFNASNILNKDTKKFYMTEPDLLRNYQVYTGYTYKSNRDSRVEIEPSLYFQYFQSDGRSETDANIKLKYLDNQRTGYFWGGVTYRSLVDQPLKPLTLGPMLGLKKGGFVVGYAYQLTLTKGLAEFNSGTHMITIGFDFLQKASNCPCTQNNIED